MQTANVEVSIVREGRNNDTVALKEYGHEGRTYIEAKLDNEYQIRVKNSNPFRVLIVASVDGLSVLTGEAADLQGAGYVVNGNSSLLIKGFRQSNDEVGAFKFCAKERGYATSKGGGANVGVIAIAAFREKQKPVEPTIVYRDRFIPQPYPVYPTWPKPYWNEPWYLGTPTWTCQGGSAGGSYNATMGNMSVSNCANLGDSIPCSAPIRAAGMGSTVTPQSLEEAKPTFDAATSWGTKLEDKVKSVEFERDSETPFAVLEVLYAFREGLKELGVEVTSEKSVVFPSAFPRAFATPPSGWTG